MYNVDKYFNFDNKQTAKSDKKKQQKQILLAVLLVGLGYYFFIYLPENQKQQENENSQSDNAKSLEELEKELQEDAKLKGRVWDLPAYSWADKEVKKIASTLIKKYQEEASIFPDGDRNEKFYFSRAASYNIHFPFALREHYIKGKEAEQENCFMLKPKEDLILSDTIKTWIRKVEYNPIRGETDKNKRDNNAIFYGAPGTGKTRTIQNICYTANRYPLVEIKGSALTPTKEDQDSKLLPLKKFVYTISEVEWTLVETYGFGREDNGEVRYILFVDEADQISNNALTHDPTKLRFLKECLEGVDQSARSNNLWVFATNHLEDVEPAVYREGRLSNPLDFSWTWGEFKKYAEQFGIINQFPQRWIDTTVLNIEDNKWIKRFNTKLFQKEFLGEDEDNPTRPKFWPLFISNHSNAILKTEIKKLDEKGKETNTVERIDEEEIEIGEFLEYFWGLFDTRDIMHYDGSFESPRTPKIEEALMVLDNTLTNGINSLITSLDELKEEIVTLKTNGSQEIKGDISNLFKQVADLRAKID